MLQYWIWFALHPALNGLQKRQLLEYYQDPEELFFARSDALSPEAEALSPLLEALIDRDLTEAEKILAQCTRDGIHMVTYGDEDYPRRLRNIDDPPMVLYYRGTLPNFDEKPVIGAVGTRKATPYGLNTARLLSFQMAACGALVISGGAAGIDTAAMTGSLEANTPTVAVLGCGVDIVYPRSNRQLFEKVLEKGCLISEYPPGTPPLSWHFPRRNRIISGISNGVLVIEAPERSGALITARLAFSQGRDVFVVPGNIDAAACAGSNALLQEQALAVFSGWDVIKEYTALFPGKLRKDAPVPPAPQQESASPPPAAKPAQSSAERAKKNEFDKKAIDKGENNPYSGIKDKISHLTGDERAVAEALTGESCSVDDLVVKTGIPTGKVLGILTALSLSGIARFHPGKRVSLKTN